MSAATPFPWQHEIWRSLMARRDSGRLPHALLFAGPAGLGKYHLADVLAQQLLCAAPGERGPCGVCRQCQLFIAGSHPDVVRVLPEEDKDLTVAQIRALGEFQTLKPQLTNSKVALVAPAERMNVNAANALLKTLEEPAAGTVIVLVSHQATRLLPTVRSRCQTVSFPIPPENPELLEWLGTRVPGRAAEWLRLAAGAPLTAVQLAEEGAGEQRLAVMSALENVAGGKASPSETASDWSGMGAARALNWTYVTLCDLIRLKSGAGTASLTQPEQAGRLQALAEPVDLTALFRLLERLQEAPRLLRGHVNAQLLLEEFLIHWATLFPRRRTAGAER